MSANTLTPTALTSEALPLQCPGWRAVEAQHQVATMGLVQGDIRKQFLLENILESSKPSIPSLADGLHWILATPFRYPPLAEGSRFRRRHDPGVFYGAEERKTACAELGYWRLRFWSDSEFLRQHPSPVQITLFEFHASASLALDLTQAPLNEHRSIWTHPTDYEATQAFADTARSAGIEAIRYESVRNPGGHCLALLSPKVFLSEQNPYRGNGQGWSLLVALPYQVIWQRDLSTERWVFDFECKD